MCFSALESCPGRGMEIACDHSTTARLHIICGVLRDRVGCSARHDGNQSGLVVALAIFLFEYTRMIKTIAMKKVVGALLSLALPSVALVLATGCHAESKQEKARRALTDHSLSDAQAIELLAEGIFDLEKATTEVGADGQVDATVIVRGADVSQMPGSVVDTAQGGIVSAMKKIHLITLGGQLEKFVARGRERKLGDLIVTLKIPEIAGGEVLNWVDAYRFRLPADRFDQYLAARKLETKYDPQAMEKIWLVDLDSFNQFTYSKSKP